MSYELWAVSCELQCKNPVIGSKLIAQSLKLKAKKKKI